MDFPGRNILFFSFLAGQAFPKFGLLVAIAGIFLQLNLIGTFWGVVLIQLVGTLLFMIWIPVAAFQARRPAHGGGGARRRRLADPGVLVDHPAAGRADHRRGGAAELRRHLLRDRGRLADRRAGRCAPCRC